MKKQERKNFLIIGLIFLLLCFLVVALTAIGSVQLTLREVWDALMTRDEGVSRTVVWYMRLPRNMMAALAGANLSVSGILLQSVMKNPLADPGITGVSSGATVVAIFILLVAPGLVHFLPLFAFIGGAIACGFVFLLAWKNGIVPIRVILAGVAVNAFLGGFISLMAILFSDRIHGALLWLSGNLATVTWDNVHLLIPYSLVGLVTSLFLIRGANVLQLGDESAKNLGFSVTRTRLLLSAVAVFLAGVTTAVVGIIGFVGLIVPHIARLLLGSDHKYILPFSIAFGGIVLLVADTLGRTVGGAIEVPVGIVTSVVGGPFFLYLLRKKG